MLSRPISVCASCNSYQARCSNLRRPRGTIPLPYEKARLVTELPFIPRKCTILPVGWIEFLVQSD
jgi:hypothetical protein